MTEVRICGFSFFSYQKVNASKKRIGKSMWWIILTIGHVQIEIMKKKTLLANKKKTKIPTVISRPKLDILC